MLVLDQWTKWAVVTYMPLDETTLPRIMLVDSWIYIIHVHNQARLGVTLVGMAPISAS